MNTFNLGKFEPCSKLVSLVHNLVCVLNMAI